MVKFHGNVISELVLCNVAVAAAVTNEDVVIGVAYL